MTLTLYGGARSRASMVRWYLGEKGIPYTFTCLDMAAGEHRQEAFLAINPFGKVPALVDASLSGPDGGPLKLFESGAILLHLAENHGREFAGEGGAARRSLAAQWVLFANASLGPAMFLAATKPEELKRLLDTLEGQLGSGSLLAGAWGDPGWGVADCAVQSYLAYLPLFCRDLDLGAWPKVQAAVQATSAPPRLPGGDGRRGVSDGPGVPAAAGDGGAELVWGQERLRLLPQRALWQESSRSLLLADLHLGKAETFQAHGIPLPSDGDAGTLNPLLELANRWRPAQVLVLGDLIHGRLGLTAELRQKLRALPELLGAPLRLVGGNHERGSWIEGLPAEPSSALGDLWLSHGPENRPGLLNVCGHRHPVAVVGWGAERLRLPCFAYDPQAERLTLPSFGELTGGHPCEPQERIWLVAEGQVLAWGEASGALAARPFSRRRRGPAPHRRG